METTRSVQRSFARLFFAELRHKDFVTALAAKARSKTLKNALEQELKLCSSWQSRLLLFQSLLKGNMRPAKNAKIERLHSQLKVVCRASLSPSVADLALLVLILRAEQQRVTYYRHLQKLAIREKKMAEAYLLEKSLNEIIGVQRRYGKIATTEKSVAGLWRKFLLKKEQSAHLVEQPII